ncbi:MAG: hypothetical protein ACT4OK_01305 [Gemmobacter sp.]
MDAIDRRSFHAGLAAAALATALPRAARADYPGPNVILVRFGGGVRRAETVQAATTYAPFLAHDLIPRGAYVPDMTIAQLDGVETSHAEGTLNLLTGRYLAYRDAGSAVLSDRLEPVEPTLFEYLRDTYRIPSHQALLVNGEDRPQEEFFTYGVHDHYGITVRAEMLSLYRFKLYKFAEILREGHLPEDRLLAAAAELDRLKTADPRAMQADQSPEVTAFWERWRARHGDDGFRNARGDRLLTALALEAMATLQPRLMMVNYQDTDYVHWGNPSHYTRAIQIIDDGLRQIVGAMDSLPFYRENTVVVVTPDCGRDANPLMGVPFQHHFNTASAREVWAVLAGPGVAKGRVLDRPADQSAIAPTIAALMGFRAGRSEGDALAVLA